MALNRTPETPPVRREYTVSAGVLRMYLSDVDAIVRYLRDNSGGVTIQAGSGAFADEAADLADATRDELRAVTISTTDPEIEVRLQPWACQATTFDPNDARATALVDKTVATLRQLSSRVFRHINPLSLLMAALFVGGGIYLPMDSTGEAEPWAWPTLIALGLFSLWFSATIGRTEGARLVPTTRPMREGGATRGCKHSSWAFSGPA